eukprot:10480505-Alexandrium_andersonii.AAC.1
MHLDKRQVGHVLAGCQHCVGAVARAKEVLVEGHRPAHKAPKRLARVGVQSFALRSATEQVPREIGAGEDTLLRGDTPTRERADAD